jgi:hypothetical protein
MDSRGISAASAREGGSVSALGCDTPASRFAPFPFDTSLQTFQHPIADVAGNAFAQRGLLVDERIGPSFPRFMLL